MESAEFAGFGDVRASLRAVCGPRWLGNWLSDCCVPNSVPVVANPEMERRNAELHRQVLSKNVAMIEKWSRLDATIRLDEDMGLASRVQSRSGAPPPVPGGERERPLKYFVVENATLKAQGRPGVSFRRSKMSTDIADTKPAAWGDVVQGVEEGDGWIRVGQYYLPTSYHGLPLVTALPTSKLRARTGGWASVALQVEASVGASMAAAAVAAPSSATSGDAAADGASPSSCSTVPSCSSSGAPQAQSVIVAPTGRWHHLPSVGTWLHRLPHPVAEQPSSPSAPEAVQDEGTELPDLAEEQSRAQSANAAAQDEDRAWRKFELSNEGTDENVVASPLFTDIVGDRFSLRQKFGDASPMSTCAPTSASANSTPTNLSAFDV